MKRAMIAPSAIFAALAVFATSCAGGKTTAKRASVPSDVNGLVADMKIGWNLGNTLDAHEAGLNNGLSSETSWHMPLTTPEMFTGIAKAGIKTVRIPVTWHNHLVDRNYTIDPEWMARVKEVTDWALDAGLYVIVNVHHDSAETADVQYGQGHYPAEKSKSESIAFLTRVWAQISEAFKNYDERLVFELMNEPRLRGHEREWWYDPKNPDCGTAQRIICEYEQECLDVIRKSGGKNASRYVMVPGYVAQPWGAMADTFTLPEDTAEGRLIISVHAYDPWVFAGENPGVSVFTDEARNGITHTFNALNEAFVQKGVGVIVGECGATNKNNLDQREAWFSYYFKEARRNGITAILWDNSSFDVGPDGDVSEHYGLYERTTQTWRFPTLLKAAFDGIAAGDREAAE